MSYSNPADYERFMGRWSARLAPKLIDFAGVRDGQRILDVGSGTGSLSHALVNRGGTTDVVGVDPVEAYVSFARQAVPHPRARFEAGAAESLPFGDESFDVTLSLLVLQDLADPDRAVREMARVTRRGGTVAACQWDFQAGIPMFALLRQAAEAVAPQAVARRRAEEGPINPTSRTDLERLWVNCGLSAVRTSTLELSMEFDSFDDFWLPLLGEATPTSAFMATLNRETDGALANALRDIIPNARSDGAFVLPARAWAVAGTAGRCNGALAREGNS